MPIFRAGPTPSKPRRDRPLLRRDHSLLSRDREGAESGVTLIELLLVVTIIALVAAISFPTASAGLDSLRLRTASDRVMSILNLALDRADALQQAVEIRISPEENAITARSSDLTLNRTLEIPAPIRMISAGIDLPNAPQGADASTGALRRYLLYPGGAPPRIRIELESPGGLRRRISIDPLTSMLHSEVIHP